MAQGTDESRPEFPDNEKPLYTPDEDARQQVVARIKQGMHGNGKQKRKSRKHPENKGRATRRIARAHLPMEQHPYISNEKLGEVWGVYRDTARGMVENPERLDPWQVRQLCELCGVTLEWLRYGGDNGYGKYETADVVSDMYARLSNEDRALVCSLLTRLLGADAVQEIKHERWIRDYAVWLERHPEKAKEIQESMLKAIQSQMTALQESMQRLVTPVVQRVAAPAAEFARAAFAKYTDEERELMEQTAHELEAQGINLEHITTDELLAAAREESVKPEHTQPR